jgi:DNA end-binding protein Ku
MTTIARGEHKRADARKNIDAIIEAAITCLARDPDVSMSQIAKTAGVGRVTLYAHFENRAVLISEVVAVAMAQTDEELEALDIDSIKAIDVVTFVPLEAIDPIYYNKTYYVAPEPSGLKAYRLLADALTAEGQVGVAKVALRDKEHLATVRLKDDIFVLETMHWPDEIREPDFEELSKSVDVRDPEVKMARQLIQQLSGEFQPENFRDEYREGLRALAERKIEGQEITVAPDAEEEEGAPVVDLMEALKASVAEAKKKKSEDDSAASEEPKSTKRRASAS